MLPREVQQNIQSIDDKIESIDKTLAVINRHGDFSDIGKMQSIASNFLVIATAGLTEKGVQSILYSFCSKGSNKKIQKYLEFHLGRETTMNCAKITRLLEKFDVSWGENFHSKITSDQRAAIDSIKALRDNLAHGNHKGANLTTVKKYYGRSKKALEVLSSIVT